MDEERGYRLKDPQTVRIFISSPFNGMEKERESLSKFHWPELESLLASSGLKLRLVDLKWGITSASSSDNQTVNICLREIERSDIFVGMYGQRYGWHGTDNKELQDNYDVSQVRFPWIEDYRERSVTELEFRKGHLNSPGAIPACFAFRDSSYDRQKAEEAHEENDSLTEAFFTGENERASKLLNNLKKEVKNTEKNTLGVLCNYTEPEDAVKFIYKRVAEFVENRILFSSKAPTERETSIQAHKCFLQSRLGVYVGGEKYFQTLDDYVQREAATCPLTIIGDPGSGKSALLANWAKIHMEKHPEDIIFFHFVGCDPLSSTKTNLVQRLIENMHLHNTGEEFVGNWSYEDEGKMLALLEKVLSDKSKHSENQHKRLIILADRIDQLNSNRTTKPLFWLPKILPPKMKVIVTVTRGSDGSDEILEVLREDYHTEKLIMKPLDITDCLLLTHQILNGYSKSMETEQLGLIVRSPKTKNPFFLNLLIDELCVAGIFKELSSQIRYLLESKGVPGLLSRIIKRLDKDYRNEHTDENIVERILCAVTLSREGLYDVEIPFAQHVWAPLIYALEKFLINRSGLIKFSFPEMETAVKNFYMNSEDKRAVVSKRVAQIFLGPYQWRLVNRKVQDPRIILELPYHLQSCNDKEKMVEVLGNIDVFNTFYKYSVFDLHGYWKFTGMRSDDIAKLYIQNLESYFQKQGRISFETEADTANRKLRTIVQVLENMINWMDLMKLYHGLGIFQDYLMEIEQGRSDGSDQVKKVRQIQSKYSKACILADSEKYQDALTLHLEVLKERWELAQAGSVDTNGCAMSYNAIGLCYYHNGDTKKAKESYTKALEFWGKETKGNVVARAGLYTNLGLIYLSEDTYSEAYECFKKSICMHEIISPSEISVDVAFNYHNMALVEKNMGNFGAAEKLYTKSLKIKEKLLGRDSYDVGLTMMNIGTLLSQKKNHKKSLECNQTALDILKKTAMSNDSKMVFLAQENVVNSLLNVFQFEEADRLYRDILDYQKQQPNGLASGSLHLHQRMLAYYRKARQCHKAEEVAIGLLISPGACPTDLAQLIMVDALIPAEERRDRPVDTTFEYGMSKWPNNRDIIRAKMLYMLHREQKNFLIFVASYCETPAAKMLEGGGYNLLIDIAMEDLKDVDLALQLVILALKIEPTNDAFKELKERLWKMKKFSK